MKRKTTVKRPISNSAKARKKSPTGTKRVRAEKPETNGFGEYLSPTFTRRLVAHMHRAKKKALAAKE